MSGLNFTLIANNSGQRMRLIFEKQADGTISVVLYGKHEKIDHLQVDFEELSTHEARLLAKYISMTAEDMGSAS